MKPEAKTDRRNPGRLQRCLRLLCDLQASAEQFRKERICTMVQVGAHMYLMRRDAGLSLRETARRLKISAPYLSDMEQGKRGQTIEWLKKLDAALKQPNKEVSDGGPLTPESNPN